MTGLYHWVGSLCAGAVLSLLVLTITPPGQIRKLLRLLCGVLMAILLFSPLREISWEGYAAYLQQYRQTAQDTVQQAEENKASYERLVIQQEMETYILDKAEALGVEVLAVELECAWSDAGCWYPRAVTIQAPGGYHAGLAAEIAAGLGIPEKMQRWNGTWNESKANG